MKKDLQLVETGNDIVRRTKQLMHLSFKSLHAKEKKVLGAEKLETGGNE